MKKAILLVSLASLAGLVLSQTAIATHIHPANNGATDLNFTVVPAFKPCVTPNSTHGSPLAGPSCAPPVPVSPRLTTGGGGVYNSVTSFDIKVICVATGSPPPAAGCGTSAEDVKLTASATDIRCKPGSVIASNAVLCPNANAGTSGKDYAGQVQGNATIQITDAFNGATAFTTHATVSPLPFPVTGTCVATAGNTAIGGTCTVATTANAVVPGSGGVVKKGKQANVEVGAVLVNDGGNDGLASTAGNNLFATQGIYIP